MAVKRPKPKAHAKPKPVKRPERELKRLANATKRAKIAPEEQAPAVVSSRIEPVLVPREVSKPEVPAEVAPPSQEVVKEEPLVEVPEQEEAAEEQQEQEPSARERSFNIGDAVEFASGHIKKRMKFFFGIMALITILSLIAGQVGGVGSKVVLTVLVIGLHVGLARLALDLVEGKEAEFKELFSCFSIIHWFILGSILYQLIVIAGLILLIIPGIIWMLAFSQWLFVLVDTRKNSFACLKKSVALTEGVKGKLIIFWLALFGINILGALALGIGLFVTIPLSIIASAHVYDQLRKSA